MKTLVLGSEEEDVLVAGRHLRLYRKIAEGGYALVYEARQMSEGEGEGEVFAVKRLICHDSESTNNAEVGTLPCNDQKTRDPNDARTRHHAVSCASLLKRFGLRHRAVNQWNSFRCLGAELHVHGHAF